ncbi:hypothetical protein VPNG_07048 [Cytospora leucostoma]|uniref:Uncharacterized protein n=1 Tax=Cytospora leucostoma TaxID=1230097 RepID=A0A423WNI7_9PEZI|nr:hypothetical protein VPNG_07048 [Cytospora leucostoma]
MSGQGRSEAGDAQEEERRPLPENVNRILRNLRDAYRRCSAAFPEDKQHPPHDDNKLYSAGFVKMLEESFPASTDEVTGRAMTSPAPENRVTPLPGMSKGPYYDEVSSCADNTDRPVSGHLQSPTDAQVPLDAQAPQSSKAVGKRPQSQEGDGSASSHTNDATQEDTATAKHDDASEGIRVQESDDSYLDVSTADMKDLIAKAQSIVQAASRSSSQHMHQQDQGGHEQSLEAGGHDTNVRVGGDMSPEGGQAATSKTDTSDAEREELYRPKKKVLFLHDDSHGSAFYSFRDTE